MTTAAQAEIIFIGSLSWWFRTSNPAIQDRTSWVVPDGAHQHPLAATLAERVYPLVPVVPRHFVGRHGAKGGVSILNRT
jgi:hypothetical protein